MLREQPEDVNPYGGGNTYTAILHHQPTTVGGHGRLVRFAILPAEGGEGFEVDWTTLPDDAEPVHYRRMASHIIQGGADDGDSTITCEGVFFGYRYWDGDTLVEEIKQVG